MVGEGQEKLRLAPTLIIREHGRERAQPLPGEGRFSIGRSPSCDLVVETGRASRHHATIECMEGQFLIIDAGSSNGTLVNGVKVNRRILDPGDIVRIGEAEIVFGEKPALVSEPVREAESRSLAATESSPQRGRRTSGFWRCFRPVLGVLWLVVFVVLPLWWAAEGFRNPFADKLQTDLPAGPEPAPDASPNDSGSEVVEKPDAPRKDTPAPGTVEEPMPTRSDLLFASARERYLEGRRFLSRSLPGMEDSEEWKRRALKQFELSRKGLDKLIELEPGDERAGTLRWKVTLMIQTAMKDLGFFDTDIETQQEAGGEPEGRGSAP